MKYIGNGFSVSMVDGDATITIKTIDKEAFIRAGETAKSIIGHPEIAQKFGLQLNRESITLHEGDVLYVVTPSRRPAENKTVENGARYEFIPESMGYTYKKIEVR